MSNENRVDVKLSDGRTASVLYAMKGKHLRQMGRMVGANPDKFQSILAQVVVATLIDGRSLTLEELDDWDDDDIYAIIMGAQNAKEAAKGKALAPPSAASPAST